MNLSPFSERFLVNKLISQAIFLLNKIKWANSAHLAQWMYSAKQKKVMFQSIILCFCYYIFRIRIQLEFSFAHVVSQGLSFIVLYVIIQQSHLHFLEGLLFHHWLLLTPLLIMNVEFISGALDFILRFHTSFLEILSQSSSLPHCDDFKVRKYETLYIAFYSSNHFGYSRDFQNTT